MKKGLKKFCLSVVVLLGLTILIDIAFGRIMDRLLPSISNQGDTGKTYYALNEVNTPILIVGSSRAAHHYITTMIEDHYAMPAYNVARDGCFYSYNYCVINSILDRYTPRIIIWENSKDDLFEQTISPLESLYIYYNKNKWVFDVVQEDVPWTESIRLNSVLYRYNSIVHRIFMRYRGRHSFKDETIKGYLPLKPKKLNAPLQLDSNIVSLEQLSEVKVERLESLLKRVKDKNVKLVIVDSPKYSVSVGKSNSAEKMKNMCEEYGVTFIDNTQLSEFLNHPEYFNDHTHLNDKGARRYTEIFLRQMDAIGIN